MTILGGGWTLLTSAYMPALVGTSNKEYLYRYSGPSGVRWYRSPMTTAAWSWSAGSGSQLTGSYDYFNGSNILSVACPGSALETPTVGIGCSSGGGPTAKVLPTAGNASNGTATICQDVPNVFGGAACITGVQVFVRPTAQSCDGLAATCGSTGNQNCCTSLEVPGGTYNRTYVNDGSGPTSQADAATVSGFRLDKYDVTVGRFRRFVAAWNGGWRPAAGSGKHVHLGGGMGLANSASPGTRETGWLSADNASVAPTNTNLACSWMNTWTNTPGVNENKPVNCVNWPEAYAFCIWDGGFLPSEAEWGYAAAGGSEQRRWPWGSTAPGTANQYAIFSNGATVCYYPNGATCVGAANVAPVGTAPAGAGRWGQLDLAGEMWNWNLDWNAPYVIPCADCARTTATGSPGRGIRGGSAAQGSSSMMPWARGHFPPTGSRGADVGFRCARMP
jgi:formylglycine-generating enzyme required for sulfatase activity